MTQRDQPDRPRTEPEIIPPGHPDPRDGRMSWSTTGSDGSTRVYVTRLGPFGTTVALILVAVVVAALLALLLGAFVIGAVVVGGLALLALLVGIVRGLLSSGR
jgi:hypothetical protein